MEWTEVHIFFDVVSAIGSVVFLVVGLLIKVSIGKLETKFTTELYRLDKHVTQHDGICDTQRSDFEKRLTRIENREGRRYQS